MRRNVPIWRRCKSYAIDLLHRVWEWATDPHRRVRQFLATALLICASLSLFVTPNVCVRVFGGQVCFPIVIGRFIDPREELRQCNNVTPVEKESDGWKMRNLPDGVYGYTTPVNITSQADDMPLYSPRRSEWRIEVHKTSQHSSDESDHDVYIVGYVLRSDLVQMNDPERAETRDIIFYIYDRPDARLIAIEVKGITTISELRSEPGAGRVLLPVLYMSVYPGARIVYLNSPECR